MKAVFLYWSFIAADTERVLDDLARWTNIDTLLICQREGSDEAGMMLPDASAFGDLPVPIAPAAFERTMQVIELARTKGFAVASHANPMYGCPKTLRHLNCRSLAPTQPPADNGLIWACPNHPDAVSYGKAVTRALIEAWPVDLLEINHVEYPLYCDSLDGYANCFCDHCYARAEGQGIDLGAIERLLTTLLGQLNSGALADHWLDELAGSPLLAQWLAFRTGSITQFVGTIVAEARAAAATHRPNLKIGFDPFLPSALHLVGIDLEALHSLFDWVAPKFPDYLTGWMIPNIADCIAGPGNDSTAQRQALRDLLDLGPQPRQYEPMKIEMEEMRYCNTADASTIDRQMPYLSHLREKTAMYPWLWLYDRDLELLRRKIQTLERYDFDGYCLWLWPEDMTSSALQEAGGIF